MPTIEATAHELPRASQGGFQAALIPTSRAASGYASCAGGHLVCVNCGHEGSMPGLQDMFPPCGCACKTGESHRWI